MKKKNAKMCAPVTSPRALALLNAALFNPMLDYEVHWHIALVWPRLNLVATLHFLFPYLIFSSVSAHSFALYLSIQLFLPHL